MQEEEILNQQEEQACCCEQEACECDETIAKLQAQLEEAQNKSKEYLDMAQRIQAEFMNYKRRNEGAEEKAKTEGKIFAILQLLTGLDSFEKSLELEGLPENVKTGLELVETQFQTALAKMGVEKIAAKGQPFDPNFHNAIMQEEAEGVEADTVLDVFQEGYRMGDRVIRYSVVKVSV